MDTALLLVRLTLFAVFAVSGVAKLSDLEGTRVAFDAFGFPSFARFGAVALPLVELAVALSLIPLGSVRAASAAAVAVMVVFTCLVGWSLARGRQPECHCFGRLHAKPIGWSTLARNFGLLGAALFVAVQEPGKFGRSVVPAGTSTAGVVIAVGLIVLTAVTVVQGAFCYQLLVRYGLLLHRVDDLERGSQVMGDAAPAALQAFGLPVASEAPEFALPGLHGEVLTLSAMRSAGRPVLLVFTDPSCEPCQSLMPQIGAWQAERSAEFTVAVLSRGSVEENRAKTSEHLVTNVLLQNDLEIAEAYRFSGTPNAVVVDAEGRIASLMAAGVPSIRTLVGSYPWADGGRAQPEPPGRRELIPVESIVPSPIGRPAPSFTLPGLLGSDVSLADFHGNSVFLAFWNPGCGFCVQITDEIHRLERTAAARGVQCVFVSAGTVEDNRALGFQSPVLIDNDEFSVGHQFGAQGTPSAIIIDGEGRIASELAVGGPSVLALADGITAQPGDLESSESSSQAATGTVNIP